ncbi:MAG: DUF6364 family protein [Candidatus Brocadiia bacterium]
MKKLTLSMDEETIKEAKRLAAEQGTSVSAMFSRLVRAMAHEPGKDIEIGPITRRASGLVQLPEGKTDKELLVDALTEKYGLEE